VEIAKNMVIINCFSKYSNEKILESIIFVGIAAGYNYPDLKCLVDFITIAVVKTFRYV